MDFDFLGNANQHFQNSFEVIDTGSAPLHARKILLPPH
jgi:hypothetical protein